MYSNILTIFREYVSVNSTHKMNFDIDVNITNDMMLNILNH